MPDTVQKRSTRKRLIPLSEAERLFGWSRDWWQKRISSGKLLSTKDESSGSVRHLIRYEDAESLSREFPFEERKEGVGRPRQHLDTQLRKRDSREDSREKAIADGNVLIQVKLSKEVNDRFEAIRTKLGSIRKKARKKDTVEHLIKNYSLD